ncbi:pentapeptide repeat-containing protein [uncultured Pelagimonas sp.]|uniref:pentapeptide repeat-containing protein n=1 Tax=uncultured Pelagimonas sp. TaxID=1618102 RepID=UPI00262FDFED|nr:pentapeptide repeat-containing protein [uncultured Pelagimonas sp.]
MSDVTTLPISPQLFWWLLGLGGMGITVLLVFGILAAMGRSAPPPLERLQKEFGLHGLNPGLFLVLAVLWVGLFLILVGGLFGLIWDVLWHELPNRNEKDALWDWRFGLVQLTALTTVLGAVIVLPMHLVRLSLNSRQTSLEEESFTSDNLTRAVENLGSEKEIVRISALLGLKEIALRVPIHQLQIERIVECHIRMIAAMPENPDVFEDPIPAVKDNCASRAFSDASDHDFHSRNKNIREWVKNLSPVSEEVRTAIEVWAAVPKPGNVRADFTNLNLQGLKISNCGLRHANFRGSNLDGAQFFNCTFEYVDFSGVSSSQEMGSAKGPAYHVEKSATFRGSVFYNCQIQFSNFSGTVLDSSTFYETHLCENAFAGASFLFANLETSTFSKNYMFLTCLQPCYSVNFDLFTNNTLIAFQDLRGWTSVHSEHNQFRISELFKPEDEYRSEWRAHVESLKVTPPTLAPKSGA